MAGLKKKNELDIDDIKVNMNKLMEYSNIK